VLREYLAGTLEKLGQSIINFLSRLKNRELHDHTSFCPCPPDNLHSSPDCLYVLCTVQQSRLPPLVGGKACMLIRQRARIAASELHSTGGNATQPPALERPFLCKHLFEFYGTPRDSPDTLAYLLLQRALENGLPLKSCWFYFPSIHIRRLL
jgi:hypothetical protein